MPPSLTKISGNAATIEEFIRDLEDTAATVSGLLQDVKKTSIEFEGLRVRLNAVCDDLEELSELVRDNKGGPGLFTRLILLEKEVDALKNGLVKKEETVRTQQQSLATIEVAEKQGKWQFKIALATGILALFASTISTLMAIFK